MTYEEYKRKKQTESSQFEQNSDKLTPYQKYREEKGLSLEPTFNSPAQQKQVIVSGIPSRDMIARRRALAKEKAQKDKIAVTGAVQRDLSTVRQELKAANAEISKYTASFKNPGVLRALAKPLQDDVPILGGPVDRPVTTDTQVDAEKLAALLKKRDALLAEYDQMTGGDNRTWFQKGAFEDGYQFGDVTKTVSASSADLKENASAGALGLGEKAVDAAATFAPYNLAAEIQGNYSDPAAQAGAIIGQILASLFMGKDPNYVQDQRNELAAQALAEAKPAVEEFIKKDLYDEKAIAKSIINATPHGKFNKLIGADSETDSFLGEKTDAVVQSAGQLAAQYGLSMVGVPWFVTSGVSSFGSEVESALNQGATLEEAGVSAAITAGAEILTEKLFGGDLFVEKAGLDLAIDTITKGISNKFIQKAAQFGLNTIGEGVEEWYSQRIGQFGQWLAYRHDERELLQLMYSEEALDEAVESFFGGVILGGGMGSVNAFKQNNAEQQAQGDALSGENAQVENGQPVQETPAEPKLDALGRIQELAALGAGKSSKQQGTNQLNIDNANTIVYNDLVIGGEQNDRTASTGEDQSGVSGVYKGRRANDQRRRESGGAFVGSGLVLLSPSSQKLLTQRGVVNVELHESSADNAAFSAALDNARQADTMNGWAVTPKTKEELDGSNVRTFMDSNASTGFGIAPDGDIEAVFANKSAGAPKGSTKVTIPLAIANGGTKLDCYGEGLVRLYTKYGFVPVARTAFNPEYANDGWTPDKGKPDIYFMMHNGDSPDTVVQNYGNYPIPTKAELDALPLMNYEEAYTFRDTLLQKNGNTSLQTTENSAEPGVNTNSAQAAEPDMYQKVQQLLASGQGKDVGQTVDTETQAEYDNENDVLDALDSMPKRTAGIEYNSGNAIRLSKREYAAVTSRISTNYHNANTEHDGIQFIDRSTDGNDAKMYMYLYRDYGFGNYEIIARLDYSRQHELIEQLREVIENERVAEGVRDFISEARDFDERLNISGDADYNQRTDFNNEQAAFDRSGQWEENNGRSGGSDLDGHDDGGSGVRYASVPSQPSTSATSVSADESVGAAPSGFDPNSHLQYQYGTLPEGEKAVRSDDLPVSSDGNNRVSQAAVTVKGAEVTPDEFSDLLTKEVTERNGLTYIPITNDATTQKAIEHITNEGWVDAKAQWHADVQNGKAGADMSAIGALLLNNAAKAGDKTAWLDILHDYQQLSTNTAQGLQAMRILKQLAPSDKLYMAKRTIKQMVKDMKLDSDVTIDPELEAEYTAAETDEQRDAVLKKIQKNVARHLPTTFIEKFTALRYVNMLGNLRTQGRNIVGNLTMKGVRAVHNTIATGLEVIANKASGGKVGRTRSVTVNKAQLLSSRNDFDTLKDVVLDGGKYNDRATATGFARGVQDQRQIFKFKLLEGYRKATNWAMEQGDIIFAKDAYARALAGYLKAKGITETDFSKIDTAVMDDARLFAIKEAQEATFRDTNWLSGWVSKIGRRKDTPAGVKILSEGVMPFRKTPANVLVRAEEYSPLGIVNSVVLSVQAAKNGSDVTGTQVINSWAKSLTGTGLFGVGMLLQTLGLLSAGPDEDEKEDRFEDLNGWQDYALTLPDGTNLTIDCFSPASIPVLMGAQLMKEINENGLQLKDIGTALTSITEPLVEMSMLQGVNGALDNIQYADNTLGQLLINCAVSYLTQGLTNTLAGQIERSFEKSRMQTYVDKDSELSPWLQRTLGKMSAKTPGWDYNQIPYINAWGEEEEKPPTGLNLIYNLISPSYFDKGKDDDLTRELNRLNSVQSDKNVYPSVPDKTLSINKQDYNLSAEEYVALAKLQGQTQKQIVEDIMANSYYAQLSDEDKAKAIGYAYEYARDLSRGEVVEGHPGITTKWMQNIEEDPAEGIIRHIAANNNYSYLSVSTASYVDELIKNLPKETGRSTVRTIQQVEAIVGADDKLSEAEQKKVLKDTLDDKSYEKYLRILALGVDSDDYAATYRIYLDAVGGKGKKARIIDEFQDTLNVSESVAEKLYDIYAGKK